MQDSDIPPNSSMDEKVDEINMIYCGPNWARNYARCTFVDGEGNMHLVHEPKIREVSPVFRAMFEDKDCADGTPIELSASTLTIQLVFNIMYDQRQMKEWRYPGSVGYVHDDSLYQVKLTVPQFIACFDFVFKYDMKSLVAIFTTKINALVSFVNKSRNKNSMVALLNGCGRWNIALSKFVGADLHNLDKVDLLLIEKSVLVDIMMSEPQALGFRAKCRTNKKNKDEDATVVAKNWDGTYCIVLDNGRVIRRAPFADMKLRQIPTKETINFRQKNGQCFLLVA